MQCFQKNRAKIAFSKEVRQEIEESYGQFIKIYDTEIPRAVKTAEATIQGTSVFEYDKNGTVAKAYENLVKEVLQDERFKEKNEPCFTR